MPFPGHWFVLVMALLAPPLALGAVVVVLARWGVRAARGRGRPGPAGGGVLLLSVAAVVYSSGIDQGGFTARDGALDVCPDIDSLHFPSATASAVPLSYVCHLPDGTSLELVPPWLNPTVGVLVALAGVTLGSALYRARQRR